MNVNDVYVVYFYIKISVCMYGRWRRAKHATFELSMHPVVRAVAYDADLLHPVKYEITATFAYYKVFSKY